MKPLTKTEIALLHTIWVVEYYIPDWRNTLALRDHKVLVDAISERWENQRMSNHRERRKRRQAKQALQHGKKAKPRHQLKAGRTGSKFSKELASRKRSA